MAFQNGARLVTDGLVLSLDAADRNSYVSGSTVWNDMSGFNNSGSLVNGPTFSFSNGGSIVFDGTNDYVVLPNNSSLTPGTGNFTFNCWVNPTALSSIYTGLYVSAVTNGIWIGKNGSNFVLRAYAVADILQYSTLPSINTWTNITISRIGTIATLYYNAVSVASVTTSQNFLQGTTYIGNDGAAGDGANLTGRFANLSFYVGKGLSSTEIQQNYNAQKSRFGL